MLFSGFDLIDWGAARLTDSANFLRSIPSLFAPKPSPVGVPYTPPFTGGQCSGSTYAVTIRDFNLVTQIADVRTFNLSGAIGASYDAFEVKLEPTTNQLRGFTYQGFKYNNGTQNFVWREEFGTGLDPVPTRERKSSFSITNVSLVSGFNNCGDPPNPNASPSINDDGLFQPNNPVIGDENGTLNPSAIILSPAAPIIAIGGGLALAAAAAAAAKAATDALEAIKKVAEALDALKELWKKLKEFLEEWEKDRPKNRDIVRQTYGTIEGDGAIDFYPLSNKNFAAIQVDIVVTEVPLGFGKYFGSMSPSRYRYKELGYISFYSINKGIIETHSIQFKRSSLAIPKTAVGFIYHFGLDNKIKGFAFGTFSVRKT